VTWLVRQALEAAGVPVRAVERVSRAVLIVAALLFPAAFAAGIVAYGDEVARQATKQFQQFTRNLVPATTTPSTTVPPPAP
jgi:hypothetical protein